MSQKNRGRVCMVSGALNKGPDLSVNTVTTACAPTRRGVRDSENDVVRVWMAFPRERGMPSSAVPAVVVCCCLVAAGGQKNQN